MRALERRATLRAEVRDSPELERRYGWRKTLEQAALASDCETNETDHRARATECSDLLAVLDFASTVDQTWIRARQDSVFEAQLHCESHDSNGVAIERHIPLPESTTMTSDVLDAARALRARRLKFEVAITRSAAPS